MYEVNSMTGRWKHAPFVQLMDFERGHIVGFQEAGWLYCQITLKKSYPLCTDAGYLGHRREPSPWFWVSKLSGGGAHIYLHIRRASLTDEMATATAIRAVIAHGMISRNTHNNPLKAKLCPHEPDNH